MYNIMIVSMSGYFLCEDSRFIDSYQSGGIKVENCYRNSRCGNCHFHVLDNILMYRDFGVSVLKVFLVNYQVESFGLFLYTIVVVSLTFSIWLLC